MFKGYIPTGGKDGKVPQEEYKNRTKFYNLDDVEKLDSYGGVLKDDLIQIDVDDVEESEKLFKIIKDLDIQCNVLKTDRGKHFYFINRGIDRRKQGYYTPLGIKIDVGLGTQNAVIPLKLKRKKRNFQRKCNKFQDIPKWLMPLTKKPIDFTDMREGDGRNQTLFNYILILQSNGFGKEEIRETIKIINKYILQEPLSESEIETILRDEAFLKQSFYKKGKLQYEELALYLRNNEKIIKINDNLHILKDNVYTSDTKQIEKVMLKYIKNSTNSIRTEVLRYLDLLCQETKISNSKYILVGNGIYNLENRKLEDLNSALIIKNKIVWSYNPNAYNKSVDNVLNKISCNDKMLRNLLEECIGYCLFRRNELGKCIILTGEGKNGKSTFLDMIKYFLGKENYSSLGLEEINQRFKPAQLEGKLANIGDDISNKYIDDNATFKKLVTGETINVERKGRDPFDFENYSKLIFSANEIPRINDKSNGLKRRLLIIPFNATFSKHDPDYDPFIKDKLLTNEAMEYLLKLALEGLQRIVYNNEFTEVECVQAALEEYEAINNPVVAFINDIGIEAIENEPTKDVHLRYSTWCIENGYKPLSNIQFSKEICKHGFNTKRRVKGIRIFKRN
ncbi:phage/plasmid primase, P4 family [Clostridium tyrobutyricum]|uniref:phage/plasmid primase, P4 family n=1 Tax=Clostridium tyrobutyricum TaxID=1519 RepID=UPI001C386B1E|nr:phage/plasmid primase, P4 family [Clostridium tyrobutyricum]MBV4429384.1 primase C-terminal domain-containing protein [Clostridium tyrobutyricum]MBV4443011.1 primase C-terminal domain-containing protein [Clostridium tyrobutyricum]